MADFNQQFADGCNPSAPNWALVIPSIAQAIISLCSMADWQSQRACR
jgi:hypothetical protein